MCYHVGMNDWRPYNIMDHNIKERAAYCAGLFEGEGHIRAEKRKGSGRDHGGSKLYLDITMCDKEPLELFQEYSGVGKIVGPRSVKGTTVSGGSYKDKYYYRILGYEKNQYIVALMWNYLSPRRKEMCRDALVKFQGFNIKPKLKEHQIEEIEELILSGELTQREIGKIYNCTQANISRIKKELFL